MKTTEVHAVLDGKTTKYLQIDSGTCFRKGTPKKVINLLEKLRHSGQEVRIYYGDTGTGQSYLDEIDTTGQIGRSTGQIKVPLLLPLGGVSGDVITDSNIVRIDSRDKTLYKHPTFFVGDITIRLGLTKGAPWELHVGEKFHAFFETNADAIHFADFLHGGVFDPPTG